jgi:hypothetical protein
MAYGDLSLLHRDPAKPAVTPVSSPKNRQQYDYGDHVEYIIDQANQRDIAGQGSKDMLKYYSHIRMQAKRKAVAALEAKIPRVSTDTPTKRSKIQSLRYKIRYKSRFGTESFN